MKPCPSCRRRWRNRQAYEAHLRYEAIHASLEEYADSKKRPDKITRHKLESQDFRQHGEVN